MTGLMNETVHVGSVGGTRSSLYVVATPIGNLADISLRALEVLKQVDVIAAEDTRVTSHLLKHYGIATRLFGALAVAAVREAGYPVVAVPGANAALCALAAAGSPTPHFLFYGFLPQQSSARNRELELLKAQPYLLVFYEAPHRVVACIDDMLAVFGAERRVTIARELTKLFESIHSCALGEAPAWFAGDANRIRGEFVLLVEPAVAVEGVEDEAASRVLEILLRELPLKQAVQLAVEISGGARNTLYKRALELKKSAS
jgi:16S rRNA (cytidine1402-2'-O)-methyltransferase